MKKYRQLKELPWSPKGTVWTKKDEAFCYKPSSYSTHVLLNWYNVEQFPDWFEHIEEESTGCFACDNKETHIYCAKVDEDTHKLEEIEKIEMEDGYLYCEETQKKVNELIDRVNELSRNHRQ